MAKTLSEEIGHFGPELKHIAKLMDHLAHRHRYDQVFQSMLDYFIQDWAFPGNAEPMQPYPFQYNDKETGIFRDLCQQLVDAYRKRCGLYTGAHNMDSWYDALGDIYMAITGTYKSSAMGQFFTPREVVQLLTGLSIGKKVKEDRIVKVEDPAGGSGRFMLAASAYLYSIGQPHYCCTTDLDPICAKMCIVNFMMNGVWGEVVCMNTLTGPNSFRWGAITFPLHYVVSEMDELQRMAFYFAALRDGKAYDKRTYVYQMVQADNLVTVQSFRAMEAEGKERQAREAAMAEQRRREALVEEAKKDAIGTLFECDETVFVKHEPPRKAEKARMPKGQPTQPQQKTLFQ